MELGNADITMAVRGGYAYTMPRMTPAEREHWRKLAECDAVVIEATEEQPVRCITCQDEGEVLERNSRSRFGSRLVPCPDWCDAANRLYDVADAHDNRED